MCDEEKRRRRLRELTERATEESRRAEQRIKKDNNLTEKKELSELDVFAKVSGVPLVSKKVALTQPTDEDKALFHSFDWML